MLTKIDLLIRDICETPDVPDPADDETILVTDRQLKSHVEAWLEQEFGLVDGPPCDYKQRLRNEENAAATRQTNENATQ